MNQHKWRMVFIRKQLKAWLIVLLVSVLLLAGLAIAIPDQGGNAVDQAAHTWMASLKGDAATALFKLFSHFGSTIAIIGVTLIASILIGLWKSWKHGVIMFAGVAAAYGVNSGLKMWFDRIRPDTAWGITADGASFPSGNAMLAMTMYGLIAIIIIQSSTTRRSLKITAGILSILLIIMMGLSRVYFHVHYITDILGGYAAGIAVVSLSVIVLHTLKSERGAASI